MWEIKTHNNKCSKLQELEKEYDMIVDCTGFNRVYLPKMKEDFFF